LGPQKEIKTKSLQLKRKIILQQLKRHEQAKKRCLSKEITEYNQLQSSHGNTSETGAELNMSNLREINLHSYPTAEELKDYEISVSSTLKKFYDTSNQFQPTSEFLPDFIGQPLSVEETSACISSYNNDMNPNMSMLGCAACGIREIDEMKYLLPINALQPLLLTDEEFKHYLQLPLHAQCCFNIVKVQIKGIQKGLYANR